MMRMTVVFPAPLGPSNPRILPESARSEISEAAVICPKRLVTSRRTRDPMREECQDVGRTANAPLQDQLAFLSTVSGTGTR